MGNGQLQVKAGVHRQVSKGPNPESRNERKKMRRSEGEVSSGRVCHYCKESKWVDGESVQIYARVLLCQCNCHRAEGLKRGEVRRLAVEIPHDELRSWGQVVELMQDG